MQINVTFLISFIVYALQHWSITSSSTTTFITHWAWRKKPKNHERMTQIYQWVILSICRSDQPSGRNLFHTAAMLAFLCHGSHFNYVIYYILWPHYVTIVLALSDLTLAIINWWCHSRAGQFSCVLVPRSTNTL